MRRVILLFAAVLFASIGWSQTMTITLEDGSTVKYNMNKVRSIDFSGEDSGNGLETAFSIIGTWKAIDWKGWWQGLSDDKISDNASILTYMQYKEDRTFTFIYMKYKDPNVLGKITKGTWELNNNYLTFTILEGKGAGSSTTWTITDIGQDQFTIKDALLGATGTLERISDSEIEKYL